MIILIYQSNIILDLMMFPYICRRNFSDFVVVKKTPSICTVSCVFLTSLVYARDWIIFSDGEYKERSNCKSCRCADNEFNHAMKSVRITIEWSYMAAQSLFPYLRNKSKYQFQFLGSCIVFCLFIVCMILKKCHASLTMNYINVIFLTILFIII